MGPWYQGGTEFVNLSSKRPHLCSVSSVRKYIYIDIYSQLSCTFYIMAFWALQTYLGQCFESVALDIVCAMLGLICELIKRAPSLFFMRQKHGHTLQQSNINIQAFTSYAALLFVSVYVTRCSLVRPTLRNICCPLHTHWIICVLHCLHKLGNIFWLTASRVVVTLQLLLTLLFVACRIMWQPFIFCVCLCMPSSVNFIV